jgi:hypothetical protein
LHAVRVWPGFGRAKTPDTPESPLQPSGLEVTGVLGKPLEADMNARSAAATTVSLFVLVAPGASPATATESFTATAIPGPFPARIADSGDSVDSPVQISINIDGWSTPADIRMLRSALLTQDEHTVRDFVRKHAFGHVVASTAQLNLPRSWKVLLAIQASTPGERSVRAEELERAQEEVA